jgi:hypothetical protein
LKSRVVYVHPGEIYQADVSMLDQYQLPDDEIDRVVGVVSILSRSGNYSFGVTSHLSKIIQNNHHLKQDFEEKMQQMLIDIDTEDLLMRGYVKATKFRYLNNSIYFQIEVRQEDILDALPPSIFDMILNVLERRLQKVEQGFDDETGFPGTPYERDMEIERSQEKIKYLCMARLNSDKC